MVGISKLLHNGEVVGYRFSVGKDRYDVEIGTVYRMGLVIDGVTKEVQLREINNLLMSKAEFDQGILAPDVSNDAKKLNHLLTLLKTEGGELA